MGKLSLRVGEIAFERELREMPYLGELRGKIEQSIRAGVVWNREEERRVIAQAIYQSASQVQKVLDSGNFMQWFADMSHAIPAALSAARGTPYSRQAFILLGLPIFEALEDVGAPIGEADKIDALLTSGFFLSAWERAGRHVYELEQDLAEALLPSRTRLTGLHGDDLRLPFPAIYLAIPPGMLQLQVPGGDVECVTGIGIVEDPHMIVNWEETPEPTDAQREEEFAMVRDGRSGVTERGWNVRLVLEKRMLMFPIPLPPQKSLHEIVQEVEGVDVLEDTDDRLASVAMRESFLFAMNAMIYATNVDGAARVGLPLATQELRRKASSAGRDRRKKIKRKLADASFEPRIILGLLETDRTVPDVSSEAGEPGPGNVLTVRSLIPGHWKRQVCGPRNTERKLIFVRPYWRGPEGAPWGQHPRRVLRAKSLEGDGSAAG